VQPLAYGEQLPSIDGLLTLFTGEKTTLAPTEGQVIAISLWASWCPGSLKVTEDLNRLAEKGFRSIALNLDENIESAQATVKKFCWDALEHIHVG
jgi:thiol-disulfide isomerase/thioredoxin